MPALTEAQRQRQIAIAKKTKQATTAKGKPKPGQKGQQTGNKGSSTKAETIGGAKPKAKPRYTPKPAAKSTTAAPVADYKDAQGNIYDGNTGQLKQAARRSPAIGAPVHASPSAFGSAPKLQQPTASPYVGSSAATPARPSTPQPAQPMSPQYGGNDEPGRLGQSEGGYVGQVRQPSPVGPVSDGGDYGHMVQATRSQQAPANENGIDEERRRAFLDADNSMAGLKAVKELLNRRKLSISVES